MYSLFKDNIWAADLADMQSVIKFNKIIRFLLYVIPIFSKYPCVIPLEDEKGTTTTNPFEKNWDESKSNPSKVWVDKGSEFYNRSIKLRLEKNNVEMHSKHNKGKSVVADRFIKIL